ncbi:MAG: tetratricopeptide repeat protein, partial [Phycisphaerales bacterium]|nr:tetratricopeptide repeat protein [Phycisphaerales bacterium]
QTIGPVKTAAGYVVGTPGYMSPEQRHGSDDIDTSTDVYSLGVVLCELLTGTTPYRKSRAAFQEGAADVAPPLPHDTMPLTALLPPDAEAISAVGRARGIDARGLRRLLRGELSWIACKAVDPDRERRYRGVADLRDDVERLSRNEPIAAAPPSWWYRASKHIRKHRAAFSAGLVAALSVVIGSVATGYFALSEARQRVLAERTSGDLRSIVEYHASLLTRLNPASMGHTMQQALFHSVDNDASRASSLDLAIDFPSARTIDAANAIVRQHLILPASTELVANFPDRPEARAILRQTLGEMYFSMGDARQAVVEFASAYEDYRTSFGADDLRSLETRVALASALIADDQFSMAEQELSTAMNSLERTGHSDHPITVTCLIGQSRLATTLGQYERGYLLGDSALSLARAIGSPPLVIADALIACSAAQRSSGCFARADEISSECVELTRALEEPAPLALGRALRERSLVLQSNGEFESAIKILPESLKLLQASLGQYHPESVLTLAALAESKYSLGDHAVGERDLRTAIAVLEHDKRESSRDMAELFAQLGAALRRQKRYSEAIECYERARQIVANLLGQNHPAYAGLLNDIGRAYLHAVRSLSHAEQVEAAVSAEPLLREAAAISAAALPAKHINIAIHNDALMWALTILQRYEEAEQALLCAWPSVAHLPPQRIRFMPTILDRAITLYEEWNLSEVGRGHEQQAIRWCAVLEEWQDASIRWQSAVRVSTTNEKK